MLYRKDYEEELYGFELFDADGQSVFKKFLNNPSNTLFHEIKLEHGERLVGVNLKPAGAWLKHFQFIIAKLE